MLKKENPQVFTLIQKEKYVIVLECQRKSSYYLLTAYYLNKEYAEKGIKKKMKKRLPNIE